jgi:hypothetical protein
MAKTVTLRIDDDVYQLFKKASQGARRTISNFLEYATLSYLTQETYATDAEMKEITQDRELMKSLRQGEKDIKEGRYRIVR